MNTSRRCNQTCVQKFDNQPIIEYTKDDQQNNYCFSPKPSEKKDSQKKAVINGQLKSAFFAKSSKIIFFLIFAHLLLLVHSLFLLHQNNRLVPKQCCKSMNLCFCFLISKLWFILLIASLCNVSFFLLPSEFQIPSLLSFFLFTFPSTPAPSFAFPISLPDSCAIKTSGHFKYFSEYTRQDLSSYKKIFKQD